MKWADVRVVALLVFALFGACPLAYRSCAESDRRTSACNTARADQTLPAEVRAKLLTEVCR